jgi:hypothetical protein
MEKGIKELLELIAGVKELALVGKAVMKDGKISVEDLAALSGLLSKQEILIAAFQGAADVPEEVKDLTLDEAMEIVTALVTAAKEVKSA